MKHNTSLNKAFILGLIAFFLALSQPNIASSEPVITQLTTNTEEVEIFGFPSVNADGKAVFVSNGNLTGQNQDGSDELFVIEPLSLPTQITNLDEDDFIGFFRIASRGNVIVFNSNTNVLNTNSDHNSEVFVINSNGTGLRQLTSTENPVENTFVSINPSGEVVAYQCTTPDEFNFNAEKICLSKTDGSASNRLTKPESFQFASPTITSFPFIMVTPVLGEHLVTFSSNKSDLVPRDDEQISRSFEIFTAEIDDNLQPLRFNQLTLTPSNDLLDKFTPRISEEGNLVAFVNASNRRNADGSFTPVSRIDAVTTDGSSLSMLYSDFEECGDPSINGDGSKIVFSCKADFTGENPDGNSEIFLSNREGTKIEQITNSASGNNFFPYIDPTGLFIVWESTANLTGENPSGRNQIFLFSEERISPIGGIPDISVPTGISFINTRVGMTTQIDFSIDNVGDDDLIINSITGPLGASPFAILNAPNTPFTLQAGASKKLEVTFSPTMAVPSMSSVRIRSNDPDTPFVRVNLFGRGVLPELTGEITKTKEDKRVSEEGTKFVINTNFIVRNTGNDDSGPFAVALFLSEDRFLDQGDKFLKELPAANQPANTSSAKEEEIEQGESTRGKFLLIHIDSLDQVAEKNEKNNIKFREIK